MRRLPVSLVAVSVFLFAGCASSKGAEKEGEKASSSANPSAGAEADESASVVELYEAAHRWLPERAETVFVASGNPVWSYLEKSVPESDTADGDEPAAGTREALRRDLTEAFRQRIGLDPTRIEGIALGASYDPKRLPPVVLFGEFEPAGPVEPADFETDRQVYRIAPKDVEVWGNPLPPVELYMLTVDQPRSGVVLTQTRGDMRKLLDDADSDSSDERTRVHKAMLEQVDDATMALAVPVERLDMPERTIEQAPVPPPTTAVVGIGSRVTVSLEGDEETLDDIEGSVEEWANEWESRVEERYGKVEEAGLARAASSNLSYHIAKSTLRQLPPDRKDGRLTYRVRLPNVTVAIALQGLNSAAQWLGSFTGSSRQQGADMGNSGSKRESGSGSGSSTVKGKHTF